MPNRVQRTRPRVKGQLGIPEGAKYVGRGTRWGNPFAVRRLPRKLFPNHRWQVVDLGNRSRSLREEPQLFGDNDQHYARVFATNFFRLHTTAPLGLYAYDADTLEQLRSELSGRDLACWCPLPTDGETDYCHAAHLLSLANPDLESV